MVRPAGSLPSERAPWAHERRRVLVVEDEPVTGALLVACLEEAGFHALLAEDGAAARAALSDGPIDLVLLDVELPGEDGFRLAPVLRARSDVGIIFVTRRAAVIDRVVGLEIGGDDYIVKPPDPRELVARVRAVLRRRDEAARAAHEGAASGPMPHAPAHASPASRRFGGWSLDHERRCLLSPRGEEVPLTGGEIAILAALLDAEGRAVARDALAEALQGAGAGGHPRTLDMLVHRIRRKLGEGGAVIPRLLLTVHGVGYRIGVGSGGPG